MQELLTAKPFFSLVFHSDMVDLQELKSSWPLDWETASIFWPKENPLFAYYSKEMGKSLGRILVAHSELVHRTQLVDLKLWAQSLEKRTSSKNGARILNIDPGFIGLEQVLLSSHKPYSHRIYLRDSIWAELVLIYREQRWMDVPWTYPDYRDEEKKLFFKTCRFALKEQYERSASVNSLSF